jgi:hypothetical protein
MTGAMTVNTRHYTVEVKGDRGYFEHNYHGDEVAGGLWFDGKTLIDYDGTIQLPHEVIGALRQGGYIVDQEFE